MILIPPRQFKILPPRIYIPVIASQCPDCLLPVCSQIAPPILNYHFQDLLNGNQTAPLYELASGGFCLGLHGDALTFDLFLRRILWQRRHAMLHSIIFSHPSHGPTARAMTSPNAFESALMTATLDRDAAREDAHPFRPGCLCSKWLVCVSCI